MALEADSAASVEPPVILVPLAPRPWGPWATIGWTVLCLVVMVLIQNVVAFVFLVVLFAREGPGTRLTDMATNGNLIATATIVSTPAVLGLVSLLVGIRRYPVRDYLALRWARPRTVVLSVAGLLAFLFASDFTSYLIGRPVVSQFMVSAYRTSWLPLLALAVVVAAPLAEETIMRGFLFKGIAESPWGTTAAIVLSSLVWALIHVQYDAYSIGTIFVMGLYLGFVRQRTGSVPLTMVLHGVANAVATAEVVLFVERFQG